MECKAKGAKSYHWERKGGDMPSNVEGKHNNNLIISNLQPNCSGRYRCKVDNGNEEVFSRYAEITIVGESLLPNNHHIITLGKL